MGKQVLKASALICFMSLAVFLFPLSAVSESLESDSISPGQVSESVSSDTVQTEPLEKVSSTTDQISQTVDEANRDAEIKKKSDEIPVKPPGVRAAEGKIIGGE